MGRRGPKPKHDWPWVLREANRRRWDATTLATWLGCRYATVLAAAKRHHHRWRVSGHTRSGAKREARLRAIVRGLRDTHGWTFAAIARLIGGTPQNAHAMYRSEQEPSA